MVWREDMRSLIVEDDELMREILQAMLSRYGVCDTAENGVIALQMFKAAMGGDKPYDLICFDIIMPVMKGNDALFKIRELEQKAGVATQHGVKAIIISAMSDFQTIVDSFEKGGCDAYLVKPVREEELFAHLKELELIS